MNLQDHNSEQPIGLVLIASKTKEYKLQEEYVPLKKHKKEYNFFLHILEWVQKTWVKRIQLCEGYIRIGDYISHNCNDDSGISTMIELGDHYKNLLSVQDLSRMTSHPYFRCASTRSLMDNRLSTIPTDMNQDKSDLTITWYIASCGSVVSIFPDHTFIIIKIGNLYFMWQSYYKAYIVSGKYGFYRLPSLAEVQRLFAIMKTLDILKRMYVNMESEVDRSKLLPTVSKLVKLFDSYTGVDSTRHGHPILKYNPDKIYYPFSMQKDTNYMDFIIYNFIETMIHDLNIYKHILDTKLECIPDNPINTNVRIPSYKVYNVSIHGLSTGDVNYRQENLKRYTGLSNDQIGKRYDDMVVIYDVFYKSNYSFDIMESTVNNIIAEAPV